MITLQEVSEQEELMEPRFIRLPKTGERCPWTGLSRSKMNQLILPCSRNNYLPPVESCSLKPAGAARGARLVLFESLMDYLEQKTEKALSLAKQKD
jgi:hypothetical protein